MGITNTLKRYTFSLMTALSQPDPKTGDGVAGDFASAVQDFVADLGVSESVKRQLIGIEQTINQGLVDLNPYTVRQILKTKPRAVVEANRDCSIYDAKPSADMVQRSGALVFVKYYTDDFGVVREPIVELVGFGPDMATAWANAQKQPRMTSAGEGRFQQEKS